MRREFACLFTVCLFSALLAIVAGCDDSDSGMPAPVAADQAPAAPAAPAVAAAPAGQPPAAQPALTPAVPPQPTPVPVPPPVVQPPIAGQPGAPGSAVSAVFVPFPPWVIAAPPKNLGGLATGNPAFPPGQGPFPGAPGQPVGPGFPPPGFPPGVNVPGVANAERKPQTEIESYEGTELFAIAPGGALAATFAIDSSKRPVVYELKLWNLTTGKSLTKLESNDNLRDMTISPDGNLLATVAGGSDEGELTLWELPAGTKKSTHNWSKYGNVSFSSDSSRIIATAGRKGIAILDLSTGKIKAKPIKNLAKTLSVQASPVEPIVAIGFGTEKRPEDKAGSTPRAGANATPKELEAMRKKVQQQQQQASQAAIERKRKKGKDKDGAAAGPNDALGLEPDAEGTIQILDLDTLKIRKKLYVTGAPADLAFNTKGTVLAALMVGGKGEIWDTATWDEQGGKLGRGAGSAPAVQPPQGGNAEKSHSIESSLLVISPDGDWAAARQSPSNRAPADIWDTRTGQPRPLDQTAVSQLAFLPDGTLVCATRDKALRFFELPAIKPVYPPFAKR